MGVRPGTNEVWIGDVGWNVWEEINRVADADGRRDELRLAVLRGGDASAGRATVPAPERLRRGQPLDLREPLQRGRVGRAGAALRVESRGQGRDRRDLSDGQLLGGGDRLRLADQQLSRRVPRRALLRRLLPRLHLGDAAGRRTGCPTRADPHVRRGRREPGRPSDRSRRRSLLRGLRRRDRPARHLHAGQPAAHRRRQRARRRAETRRSPFSSTARARAIRTRATRLELRLGPRRRRPVRRLDRGRAEPTRTRAAAASSRACGSRTARAPRPPPR